MTTIEPPTSRLCGTMPEHRRLLSESADYRRARAELETATIERQALASVSTDVVHLPVVVHVVAHTDADNISDAQIHSQIEVLNHDFRATNDDIDTVPEAFRGRIGDARVEFFLATIDPEGEPTSGITRTETAQKPFTTDNKIKFYFSGGIDAWPTDRYLNIWVGPLGGGLLGYAQFPGGPDETDGVVISNTAFGTTGTARAPFDLGRTATHEIGHYLNLFHIWGDDGSGCGGTDGVSDTPTQASENIGKPGFPHISCNNAPHGDLFMDYMDCTDDDSMMMFTAGQVRRMRFCLGTARATLVAAGSVGAGTPTA